MPANRNLVHTRRALAQTIADAFLPLERAADQTAIAAHRCLATLFEQRIAAGLDVTAGEAAIVAIQEGCRHSDAAQASFRRAHKMFPDLMTELGIANYSPECPTGDQEDATVLRIAS